MVEGRFDACDLKRIRRAATAGGKIDVSVVMQEHVDDAAKKNGDTGVTISESGHTRYVQAERHA